MGFQLAQIINKVLNVQLFGSSSYKSYLLNITTTPLTLNFPFTANSFQFANDGSDYITLWLQGKQPANVTVYNDSHIALNGTGWGTSTVVGYGTYNTNSNTSASAVYNPGLSVNAVGFTIAFGGSTGKVNFQLSSDGVTWVNPSTIAGVLRSDGATGTDMDTLDTYYNGTIFNENIIFLLPSSGNWQVKVVPVTNILFLGGGITGGADGIIVKSGEIKTYPISSNSVSLLANTGSQSIRMDVIS